MLNAIIRFSLHNRLLVAACAMILFLYGSWQAYRLPIDVFPDLDRPRVVVLTEALGMAPEEVETLVTVPLETVLNGATGVQAVRSSSGVGLSIIYVEFDWGTDLFVDRQIVNERLALVADQLPEGIQPHLAPIGSIMGQIELIGLFASGEKTSPMDLRTLADWVICPRLKTISGVSQVIVMGGERQQFQVLVSPHELLRYGVTLREVKQALRESNQNTVGGYLSGQGASEILVRSLGRVVTSDEIEGIVVTHRHGQSVRIGQVARVVAGAQTPRGTSSAFARDEAGVFQGGPAVVLTITKQPGADTRRVTQDVQQALAELGPSLPSDVRVMSQLYRQQTFIDLAVANVAEALRDGSILVVIILFLFLLNLRITLITLTAIPLSLAATAIVFQLAGLSINTMTLGGLAVAIGELVDDAIVDVENVFRRLRENRHSLAPLHPLIVVYQASCEIRNSIVYGTLIVILVFVPLFALGGIEGRLFTPLGVAYIVSIVSSLVVSLTVTPVLSYWLLGSLRSSGTERDGVVLRVLKWLIAPVVRLSVQLAWPVLAMAVLMVGVAGWGLLRLERDFLPPFNEGAVQINVLLPPGTSLARSDEVARQVETRLQEIGDLVGMVRKTGRAELDEHAEGVHVTEFIVTLRAEAKSSRSETLDRIEEALADIPGIVVSVEQPLAHLISHMLSGVKAQVAVKIYGDDLDILRREAKKIETAMSTVAGVRDLQVEQQTLIPQLRIEAQGDKLAAFGLRRLDVNGFVETAMQGEVVSRVIQGQRSFDLVVRLDDIYREDLDALKRLAIELPDGGTAKLEDVARIYPSAGPNTIHREQVRRRILVQCNIRQRGLVDAVDDIARVVEPLAAQLPTGYFVEYGGQFESQQSASRIIGGLLVLSLGAMFLTLYTMFGSANLALQVMVALPMAFIGAVAALYLTGQTLTVAATVGFISLCGIAARNGILLINHYLHLVKYEGQVWSQELLVRAAQDRLAPVLMTALTSGIGLIPLILAGGEPGKEILYPVATVMIGGMVTSTLLEFLVRPALFWKGGQPAIRRALEPSAEPLALVDSRSSPST